MLRDLSLKWKLPLVLSSALAVAILVLSAAAYREVHRAQLDAASERLHRVSEQWTTLAEANFAARETEIRTLTLHADVLSLLSAPGDPSLRAAAEEVFAAAAVAEAVVLLEVLDPDGTMVLAVGDTTGRPVAARPLASDESPVGPLLAWQGEIVYSISSPVTTLDGRTGTVVLWRAVQPVALASQLRAMIGEDLRVLYGTPGNGWTDLVQAADEPAIDFGRPADTAGVVKYARPAIGSERTDGLDGTDVPGSDPSMASDAGPVYAVERAIAPTPWHVVVELPEAVVLADARAFLLRLLLLAPLALLAVALIAWLVGSRLAHALTDTAEAAGAIAAGEGGRRVRVRGTDEIGDLAAAFNAMAQKIEDSKLELESANARMARSNADLEDFAYIASHDLREPLRMVRSFTGLLAERYKGQLDAEADEFIHFAVDGAERMDGLISALLTYSRLDGDRGEAEVVDAEAALERVLQVLSPLIAETGAVVTHDPLPKCRMQPGQLTQVLQNLLKNALTFHRDGPPEVHVSARAGDTFNVYSVRDNGIGIAPRYSRRIFEIFKRLHSVAEFGGTGMGLSICKKVVERHGGQIWVESTPGEGSTFYFTMPAARAVPAGRPWVSPGRPPAGLLSRTRTKI